jgi:hypothetical protein
LIGTAAALVVVAAFALITFLKGKTMLGIASAPRARWLASLMAATF